MKLYTVAAFTFALLEYAIAEPASVCDVCNRSPFKNTMVLVKCTPDFRKRRRDNFVGYEGEVDEDGEGETREAGQDIEAKTDNSVESVFVGESEVWAMTSSELPKVISAPLLEFPKNWPNRTGKGTTIVS